MSEIIDQNIENMEELIKESLIAHAFGGGFSSSGSKIGYSILKQKKYEKIRSFINFLPSINYVVNQITRYVLADGIQFEKEADTKKFKEWLAQTNIQGESNKSILNKVLVNTLEFGHAGLRMLSEEDGWLYIEPDHYGRVTVPSAEYGNVRFPLAYIVSEKKKINRDIIAEDLVKYGFEFLRTDKQITAEMLAKEWLATEKLDISNSLETHTLLPTESVLNMTLGTTADYRDGSPFLREEGRLYMLYVALKRISEDVEYDGLGTLLFQLKNDLLKELSSENGLSTGTLIKEGATAKAKMSKDVEENTKKIADSLSKARRNNSIVMNPYIEFKEQLKSDTRAVELLDYASKYAGTVMAEAIGVSPRFLQLMQTSSDISMDATFKEGMRNAILPLREQLLSQIDDFVSEPLGITSKMKFELPDYLDTRYDDDSKVATTYANIMKASDRDEIDKLAAEYLTKHIDSTKLAQIKKSEKREAVAPVVADPNADEDTQQTQTTIPNTEGN